MKRLLLFTLLAVAPSLSTPAAGQAETERVLRTRVVTATFVGWERGDYLWARLDVRGRGRITAMPGDEPIGPFLGRLGGASQALSRHCASHLPEEERSRFSDRPLPRTAGQCRSMVESPFAALGAPRCAAITSL